MIDVSEVVNAPELAQNFTVMRSAGVFVNGSWVSQATALQGFGVISVARAQDIEMLPEGDVIHGAMVFHSSFPLFTTQEGVGSSDILQWNNSNWRVLTVSRYSDYGYYRAVAARIKPAGG